jgi:hypothetical protein
MWHWSFSLMMNGFRAGTVAGFLINLGFYGQLFVMSLYFQDVRGYSALRTGLALLPEAALLTIASAASGRLTARTGPRVPMLTGLLLGGAGLIGRAARRADRRRVRLPGRRGPGQPWPDGRVMPGARV